jgi:peptidoglycan-associated lipoprotein
MNIQTKLIVIMSAAVALVLLGGCKKQKTVLPEPTITKPQSDNAFPDIKPLTNVDTSDNVSFQGADLDEEFQRLVQENLQTIYFDYNQFSLSYTSVADLKVAAQFLMQHPTARVVIEGHCDERGSADYNMGLGENRARTVKKYLSDYGIPSLQLEVTSWGKERLVRFNCAADDCHQENRRAEFKVLSR